MKKIWAGVLAAAVLLLTACSAEEAAMRKKFFTRNDKAIANERFEALIDAIQARDGDAVRALFSKNVLRETGNLEDAIPALFDYFQGKMLSYDDWGTPKRMMASIGKATTALMTLKRPRTSIGLPWNL